MKKILLISIILVALVLVLFRQKSKIVQTLPDVENGPVSITENTTISTFAGTIKRFTRPEADIFYDYQIVLLKPVIDTENASGLNQLVSFYVLVPASEDIKQQLESSVDKNVVVQGQMKWGYAESKYLSVTKVTLK